MPPYQAVLFDMFDTLVNFERERLPLVSHRGTPIRTTSPSLYGIVRPACPTVSLDTFIEAFFLSYRTDEAIRARGQREVSAEQRFRILFDSLGIDDGPRVAALLQAGIAEHQRQLARAVDFPEPHRTVLERLRPRYRLGLVSNFDHVRTVEATLRDCGILDAFETVVVSAAIGWRKPRPEIFREALRRLGLGLAEAVFIGETPEADVAGAQAVGMDAIWLDHGTKPLPHGLALPTHTVSRLEEVLGIL
jgi:HAD superfamily hydrolase (TIGR01509 family)